MSVEKGGSGVPSKVLPSDLSREESQADFELDFFGRILDRHPQYVDVLKLQASHLARSKRHGEALPLDRRLVNLLPQDGVAHYNLACSLACTGRVAEAMVVLGRSLQLGYVDFAHLEFDPDLDNLRETNGYRELMRA